MNKEDILKHLREAKASHINWVQHAKLLVSGFDIDKESIPVSSTECSFGKWFYSDGQMLHGMHNNPIESMRNIERLHSLLHDIYLDIFKIYYDLDTKNISILSKLLGLKRKISKSEQTIAMQRFEEIQKVSKELLEEIDILQKRISVVGDKEIKELI